MVSVSFHNLVTQIERGNGTGDFETPLQPTELSLVNLDQTHFYTNSYIVHKVHTEYKTDIANIRQTPDKYLAIDNLI